MPGHFSVVPVLQNHNHLSTRLNLLILLYYVGGVVNDIKSVAEIHTVRGGCPAPPPDGLK